MRSPHNERSVLTMPLLAGFMAMTLAGCATPEAGIQLHGGQTSAQLAQARTDCAPFVLAHSETTTELAEAACLIARDFRAPLWLALGSAPLGSLHVTPHGDATAMVRDFQECRLEARDARLPTIQDENRSGVVVRLYDQLFPRSGKVPSPDALLVQAFGACLSNRGYTVSDIAAVTPH